MQRLLVSLLCLIGLSGAALAETQFFQSPSGNIQCVIGGGDSVVVRCDLGVDQLTYDQKPATCDGDWGQSFGVMESGVGFINCVTDAIGAPKEVAVLPYGVDLVLDGVTCRSETTGMTCTNTDGGGFSVRRAEQRIF